MIDQLIIQIPFSKNVVTGLAVDTDICDLSNFPWGWQGIYRVDPLKLPFKVSAKILEKNSLGHWVPEDIYCPWDSISSSLSGLAIKPFHEGNGTLCWPYLEIKASPAKLVQGHNVFGTDSIRPCVNNMLYLLSHSYPGISEFVDLRYARISSIDITYSVSVPLEAHRRAVINTLKHLSKGQTKNRGDNYQSTVYFGSKNSRLKRIKVYLKGIELLNDLENRKRKRLTLPPSYVIDLSKDLVRFELTLKKDWFERRTISTRLNSFMAFLESDALMIKRLYNEGCRELFDALCGEVLKVTNDKDVFCRIDSVHGDVRGRTARLMGFFQALKSVGYDNLKNQYPERSFRRYINDLESCGFSRALLCSLHDTKGVTVINFPQLITLDRLDDPVPPGYVYPDWSIAV